MSADEGRRRGVGAGRGERGVSPAVLLTLLGEVSDATMRENAARASAARSSVRAR